MLLYASDRYLFEGEPYGTSGIGPSYMCYQTLGLAAQSRIVPTQQRLQNSITHHVDNMHPGHTQMQHTVAIHKAESRSRSSKVVPHCTQRLLHQGS